MKSAGFSDEFVISKIQRSPADYQLDTADVIALKKSNVSEAVIQAMMAATTLVVQPPEPHNLGSLETQPAPATDSSTKPAAGIAPASNQQSASNQANDNTPPKHGAIAKLKGAFSDPFRGDKATAPQTSSADSVIPPQLALVPVTIISKPTGARIWLDGYSGGVTPAVVKLVPRTYKLTLQANGYQDHTQQMTVEAGKLGSVEVTLDAAK